MASETSEYVRNANGQWVTAAPAQVVKHGRSPIVVSAPHSIPLRRDGHPNHKKEDYTRYLATCFAEAAGGTALCWLKGEETRLKAASAGGWCRQFADTISPVPLKNQMKWRAAD